MPRSLARIALVVIAAFIAVTAIYGALFVVPELPLDWLKSGPFTDFAVPAIALGFVGLAAIVAGLAAIFRPDLAGMAAVVVGGLMIVFELVEVWVVGFALVDYGTDEPVAWLQVIYVALGLVQMGIGAWLWGATRDDRDRRHRTGHGLAGQHL